MKIVVFGATGRTGIPLVQQALDAGHEVIGFVRDPAKMPIQHARLSLAQGDVMDAAAVDRAISADADAVISTLGATNRSPSDMLPAAVGHILKAMQRHGIKRLVFMTGAGVDMPQDRPKLINHLIKFALMTLARAVAQQSEEATRLVQNSGLDWVIVRVPRLNDNPFSGRYRVGWVGVNTGPNLSRADAADFILKQLHSDEYLHQAPVISN
ncbi:MAG: SDR family oxidoreductase [Caldilineaceae bacterium]|nr:SDR family oxidoreductase [Caldilineaceae bacterium]